MDKKEQALKLIADILEIDAGILAPEVNIKDVEGWDSMAQLQIVGEMEELFHITIPIEKIMDMKTVGDLLIFVE